MVVPQARKGTTDQCVLKMVGAVEFCDRARQLVPHKEMPSSPGDFVAELQKAAGTAAKAHSSDKVKDVMKDVGVVRLGELAQDKRRSFLDDLEKLGQ